MSALKTAFATAPGFYAAMTRSADNTVPAGSIRLYCARIEAYEGPLRHGEDFDQTSFKLLAAMATEDKRFARALLELHGALTANLALIKQHAA